MCVLTHEGETIKAQSNWKSFLDFALKVIVAHMATYFIFGIIMSNGFDYGEIFQREIIRDYMIPMDEHNIVLGPFLQPVRGLIFAIGLWPLRNFLVEKKRGWLTLWGLLVTIGILSTPAAAPGSIEGMLYSKLPMWYHLMGYPEIVLPPAGFLHGTPANCAAPDTQAVCLQSTACVRHNLEATELKQITIHCLLMVRVTLEKHQERNYHEYHDPSLARG